jgi:hypothetical protein
MRPRSRHCIENHGDASRRTSQGGCAQCRYEWTRAKQIEKRVWLARRKLEDGCAQCGYDAHPAALHFHHTDGATKDLAVSEVAKYGWARIRAEVAKCDVLCANCHAALHASA